MSSAEEMEFTFSRTDLRLVRSRPAPLGDRAARRPPSVSVVIPALNEATNLPHVLRRLPEWMDEVILVDGGCTDETVEVATQCWPDIQVVRQSRRGKGNALACGFRAATADIIVMLDADGSADPLEIPRFVAVLLEGADFAKGSRFISGGGSSDITRLRRLGNRALNRAVNSVFRTKYTDLCYGYNAFWRRCLDVFMLPPDDAPTQPGQRLWGDGFEIETLINVRAAKAGLVIHEVPSYEYRRIYGESNLSAVSDGWRVLRTISTEAQRPPAPNMLPAIPRQRSPERCELHNSELPCCFLALGTNAVTGSIRMP